jgi:HEAT repeat protein
MPTDNISDWAQILKDFAAGIGAKEWPGNPGVTEEQLAKVEQKLKVKLPPSYRAFLSASNGWRQASRAVPVLRPVEKIKWFRREHRDWVQAYVEPMRGLEPRLPAERDYFNYGSEAGADFDVKHLAHTLCLSEVGDSAVLLLNPMVVWPDGEWEAWFFANWLPGAMRYRSFADWMRHEVAEQLDEPFDHHCQPGELPSVYLDAPSKPNRRIRPREEILELAQVFKKLESKQRRNRIKAVQQLCQLGGKEAVTALINALKNDAERDVRCEAAEALGRLGDIEAVEALIAAVADRRVSSIAIHALAGFSDAQSAEFLLKMLESGGLHATVAVYPLAKRHEDRAVGHLVRFLTSKEKSDFHIGNIAGRMIAMFGEAGLGALEPLILSPDDEIRHRVICGVNDLAFIPPDKNLKAKARKLLEKCLEAETDPRMHQWLAGIVDSYSKKFQMDKNPFSNE